MSLSPMESSKLTFPDNHFLLEYRGSDFRDEEKIMAKINLPQQLVRFVDGETVEIDAPTVGEVFAEFLKRYPTLEKRLIKEDGSFNTFINIYVNDEDIRFLNGKNTVLKNTDEITIVPSTAGG